MSAIITPLQGSPSLEPAPRSLPDFLDDLQRTSVLVQEAGDPAIRALGSLISQLQVEILAVRELLHASEEARRLEGCEASEKIRNLEEQIKAIPQPAPGITREQLIRMMPPPPVPQIDAWAVYRR